MLDRPSVQFVTLDIPEIISVNELRRPANVKGKFRLVDSREYLNWKSQMGYVLNSQRPGIVEGPYALTITVSSKWRGDIGNVEKQVSDLLKSHGVIDDDKFAQRILIERGDVDGVRVMVCSTKDAAAQ